MENDTTFADPVDDSEDKTDEELVEEEGEIEEGESEKEVEDEADLGL